MSSMKEGLSDHIIPESRPILRVKVKLEDKIKVLVDEDLVEGVVEAAHQDEIKIKLPSGDTVTLHPGSNRLYPISSALSNPEQLAQLNSGREKIGRIVKDRFPVFKHKLFVAHDCGPRCLPPFIPALVRGQNYLLVPLRLGWRREAAQTFPTELCLTPKRWSIFYVAPCGRRLKSIEELVYLEKCNTRLEIDCFTFDPWVNVRDRFMVGPLKSEVADISDGKEHNPIPAVNAVDDTKPWHTDYSGELLPQGSVNISSDKGFLVGCSCTNNCTDKKICACAQLTIRATAIDVGEQLVLHDAGYTQRRLKDVLITGIYECNSQCACSSTCHNRVAQHPIKVQLQVFKTEKRGWGLRALHDIPQGTFVCKYVGNLYNTDDANAEGQTHGDDYFCELDLIELVEKGKDGYESDVTDIEAEAEDKHVNIAMDHTPGDSLLSASAETVNSVGDKNSGSCSKVDFLNGSGGDFLNGSGGGHPTDGSEMIVHDGAHTDALKRISSEKVGEDKIPTKKFRSIRSFYHKSAESDTFIVDAMKTGNVGRYLNHSCDPNVFVQNIFEESHDLRFPTVAFFTCKFVKAGDELCWNYSYEVDSVPGRRIDCHCGADICKKRLL